MTFHRAALSACLLALLAACTTPPPQVPPAPPPPALVPPPVRETVEVPGQPTYRCEDRTEFSVRFADDSAFVDFGALGKETLLRDAGGVTPEQSVYSSKRVRAEFGLGINNRDAVLHYLSPAKDVRCSRD